jgi:hypothetical protein
MAQPTLSDVHVNQALTQISVAYLQDPSAFVASRVFPNVPVEKASDRYYVFNRGDFNRDDMQLRAPGTESQGSGYSLDNTPSYSADVWALHKDIPDQIRANSDSVLSPDLNATQFLTTKALIRKERLWATNYFTTSLWTSGKIGQATADSTHVVFWNDYANSTPIEDMRAAKRAVHLVSGGFAPNKIVFGPQVWDTLVDHPDFVDRIKYGQTANPQMSPAMVSRRVVAELLEVDEILVMEGIYNNVVEGGTETEAYIGGKNALMCYAAPSPGLMVPSAGYTFSWTGFFGAGVMGNRIKSFRMEWLESDRVEIEMAFALKLIGADLGYFFSSIIQ